MCIQTLVLAPAASAASSEARRVGAVAIDPDDTDAVADFLAQVRLGTVPASPGEPVDYRALAPRVATVLSQALAPGALPSQELA